ncbi:MAG: glycoside hydrolase family 32 protein [Verrucomicrobiales bacterium]
MNATKRSCRTLSPLALLAMIAGASLAAAAPAQSQPETPAFPADPPSTWLTYHLAHPGTTGPGDPNAGFYWKGRYHLYYIYEGKAGTSWAHVSSTDMVHWKWHPTTLTPATMGHNLFSGTGFFTKEGKPAIIYHGEGSGRNQIAFAEDDLLERWSKPVPVEPKTKSGALPEMRHWDPDCWLDGETYYAVSGGKDPHWMKSSDLKSWEYLGRLLHDQLPTLDVPRDEDISCPNMFRIGDKWMLLCLSHWIGSRYYLGRFQDEKFLPESHGRMNWMCAFQGGDEDADVYAPESLLTPDGRRVMWAWARMKHRLKDVPIQSSIQCLPRELSLPPDGVLRIKPLRELEQLRHEERSAGGVTIAADSSHRLENITGDTLELNLTFQPGPARKFGVHVYCDQDGKNGFPISYEPEAKMLTMGETRIPFSLPAASDLELRVFLDKSIIEIFVNDRLAALAPHRYASEDLGLSLFSEGGTVRVKEVKGWSLRSIYSGSSTFAPADPRDRR